MSGITDGLGTLLMAHTGGPGRTDRLPAFFDFIVMACSSIFFHPIIIDDLQVRDAAIEDRTFRSFTKMIQNQ